MRGMAATEGRVMTSGRYFGEDMIMDGPRRHASVRALTYLDVYILMKEDLDEILESGDYPETKKLIRKQVIRLCLRKKFMSILNLVRSTKGLTKRPKEEYETWKEEMAKKNSKKRALRNV